MARFLSTMRMDVLMQVRNQLYVIGIGAGVLVALALSRFPADQQYLAVPTLMILVAGGSTLLYVAALITFEREEGTLNAVIVSPIRTTEYLWSKIITLTTLATIECVVMVFGGWLMIRSVSEIGVPNLLILFGGIVALGVIYTLLGIVLIVRYDNITNFLMPMAAIATILQLPFLHFIGMVVSPLWLIIPSSAPTMLVRGAYVPLTTIEWVYAIGYTALQVVLLTVWAHRSFYKHIILKVG